MEERMPGRCRPIWRHPVLCRSSREQSKMELVEDRVRSAIAWPILVSCCLRHTQSMCRRL